MSLVIVKDPLIVVDTVFVVVLFCVSNLKSRSGWREPVSTATGTDKCCQAEFQVLAERPYNVSLLWEIAGPVQIPPPICGIPINASCKFDNKEKFLLKLFGSLDTMRKINTS
ncbi:MAG: hypothetical protein P8X89_17050 [Reinekea sp.]